MFLNFSKKEDSFETVDKFVVMTINFIIISMNAGEENRDIKKSDVFLDGWHSDAKDGWDVEIKKKGGGGDNFKGILLD
jgi:hypothetical protein